MSWESTTGLGATGSAAEGSMETAASVWGAALAAITSGEATFLRTHARTHRTAIISEDSTGCQGGTHARRTWWLTSPHRPTSGRAVRWAPASA